MLKYNFLAGVTFFVLAALVFIQVSLIFRAARLEEQNFNYRVAKALDDAHEELGVRVSLCRDMHDFLCKKKCAGYKQEKKRHEVDSIIRSKLVHYQIDLAYTFEVTDAEPYAARGGLFAPVPYLRDLRGLLDHSNVKIKLLFPNRGQFILWQIKSQIGLSILFIIFVTYSFLVTNRMLRREKSLLLLTTDFINNMAHEFQTPIANIRLASRLINKELGSKGDADKTSGYTGVIMDETMRLQSHVDSILKIANPGSENPESTPVEIDGLINEIIKSARYRIENAGATVNFTPAGNQANVLGDKASLELAISNIIDNALKYNKGKAEISIETYIENHQIIIKISDNGIGIDEKFHGLIFEKFFRVPTGDVHDVKGFGLGLTRVKKVVLQTGGSIMIRSIPGNGTTFTLKFPLHDGHTS